MFSHRGAETGCGCLIFTVILIVILSYSCQILDDEASAPQSEHEVSKQYGVPQPETANVYVTGDDGGAFEISWVVWTSEGNVGQRENSRGTIQAEPTIYPIDLTGFKSDGNDFFLGTEDFEIEARKVEPWEGDLTIVLEVNGEVVECNTINASEVEPHLDASISFDADNIDHYERNFGCQLNLRLF